MKNFELPLYMQLTQRQHDVSERLIEGMTIAAIADDLGLTESRVNQIIRALKNRFGVDTQAGIVAAYRDAREELEAAEDGIDAATGSESLVPDLLNTPHPLIYRLVAISLAALLLVLTLYVLTEFAIALSEASESRRVATLDSGASIHG